MSTVSQPDGLTYIEMVGDLVVDERAKDEVIYKVRPRIALYMSCVHVHESCTLFNFQCDEQKCYQ